MGALKRALGLFADYYKVFAVVFVNCLLIFIVLNLIADSYFATKSYYEKALAKAGTPFSYRKFNECLRPVHPELNDEQIDRLIQESRRTIQIYEPFSQFKEQPVTGQFVNIDPKGYRLVKNQKSWPPPKDAFTVFIFGGSTTLGVGVADYQTIPSHIQELLASEFGIDAWVYNFGRGMHYSLQERVIFERLLMAGYVPNVAIFIDGLNDLTLASSGLPGRTKDLSAFMQEGEVPMYQKVIRSLPLVKFVMGSPPHESHTDPFLKATPENRKEQLKATEERYRANLKLTKAIAEAYGVVPIFVWQPVPVHKYNNEYCVFGKFEYDLKLTPVRPGYEYMAKRIKEDPLGPNFIWAADIQNDSKKPLYVDAVHYSSELNQMLARFILENVRDRRLVAELNSSKYVKESTQGSHPQ